MELKAGFSIIGLLFFIGIARCCVKYCRKRGGPVMRNVALQCDLASVDIEMGPLGPPLANSTMVDAGTSMSVINPAVISNDESADSFLSAV